MHAVNQQIRKRSEGLEIIAAIFPLQVSQQRANQTTILNSYSFLFPSQTSLVMEAVKKDQQGDAAAALSLYSKALEYFVPALRCECPDQHLLSPFTFS